jgi:ATP-dependent protease HslVU (ClpYQ) peptidase subunit
MTTIAAIQGNGYVVMGADSQGTYNDYRNVYMKDHKVVDNNGILIAGCGIGRGMNLLQRGWKAPKPPRANMESDKLDIWMVTKFIPGMRQLFIDGGYDMKDDGEYAQFENVFLIAVQGTLYILDEDYSLDRDSRNYFATGTGGDFAQGSLYSAGPKIFTDVDIAAKAMTNAVNAAKEFDTNSGGETRIYTQYA